MSDAALTQIRSNSPAPDTGSTGSPQERWRLGATSFVHPGGWAYNVEKLGCDFDDIEILFFEGASSSLPSARECQQLLELKKRYQLSYSLHTPLCASLASPDDTQRQRAVETILRSLDTATTFEPEHAVLHVYLGEKEHDPHRPTDLDAWRERAHQSLQLLCRSVDDPRSLCVESIDYDIALLAPVIEDLKLSMALDIGHWVRDGRDTLSALRRFLPHTRLVQWHGTDPEDRDHRSLHHYPDELGKQVLRVLREQQYAGVVTLEVFRPDDLQHSVTQLQRWQAELEPGRGSSLTPSWMTEP